MNTSLKQLIETYSPQARIARTTDKVYKDECVYSYDNAESPHGLFVCLQTFIGVSKAFLPIHFAKTRSHLYLHTRSFRRPVPSENATTATCSDDQEPEMKKKPTKLGIGIDGGFDLAEKQFYFENEHSLYVYPEDKLLRLDVGDASNYLTENVRLSVDSVRKAESQAQKEELASQTAAWETDKRFISRHSAHLLQLNNGVQISPDPNSWKCELCDIRKNLWLNLIDGKILCGRRQLDGSGGNNHAVEHYNKTKYPLSVKLGTITATGADIYSYDEDDMVEDTNLAVHLAHFGINMAKMEKTDKTMTELEIDLNQKVGEWDRIQESGSKLVPMSGSGFTGMRNMGNSCYMNSVIQLLFSLPEFVQKYVSTHDQHAQLTPIDPSNEFNMQMSKLGFGLFSGHYSVNEEHSTSTDAHLRPPKGIKPVSFKSLVGRGHPEFSTKRQQDAHEFLIHLFTLIERGHRTDPTASGQLNPLDSFQFKLTDRIECSESHQVRYKLRDELCLSLPVSQSLTVNKERVAEFEKRKAQAEVKGERLEPGDIVRPEIRLEDCLRLFTQQEVIADFYSSAVKRNVNAWKTTGFSTFPDYLLIQVKKFEFAPDWSPIKLDIALQVPDVLDINSFRSNGLQAGEVELSDEDAAANDEETIRLNKNVIRALVDMGFSLEGSKRAAYNTRESSDAEAAVNWAISHMEDSDFNSPFVIPSEKPSTTVVTKAAGKVYDEEKINSIVPLGFTRAQAIKALEATGNNVERAVDWIFNHPDELMDANEVVEEAATAAPTTLATAQFKDGNGLYELIGFISHMGTNANVGHYVAHLLKYGKWTIFNDENVALSENPPKDLAYLYLYRRKTN